MDTCFNKGLRKSLDLFLAKIGFVLKSGTFINYFLGLYPIFYTLTQMRTEKRDN
jgi:hypothetical protein